MWVTLTWAVEPSDDESAALDVKARRYPRRARRSAGRVDLAPSCGVRVSGPTPTTWGAGPRR